jgi:hypothetical protein
MLSRSLRRPEDRGLLRRRNQVSGDKWDQGDDPLPKHRTTHLLLTAEGRALADWLAQMKSQGG